ncbi:unnamed protein product [Clavelina lepadiformis]|uniref:Uncharacterized protein n=1 Tax=Clavelina lepadiformis TaxID=159417 RepID=A0ABP0G5Y7_CLALP
MIVPYIAEKRRIWIEALKSQLVHFEKLQWDDWDDDHKRRYISLLCELNESSDMDLFNMASLHFPTEMNLYRLKLSSSEAAIFCDVLRKQRNKLKKLDLSRRFSPGDVERLISAISEMPGKVKALDINGNIIKDIPGPEFFTKIEEYLWMDRCFEDDFSANSSEKQKIQLALDQLHGSYENFKDIHRGAERSTKASTFEVVTEMPLVLHRQFQAISALVMALLTSACDGILTPVFCMSSNIPSNEK